MADQAEMNTTTTNGSDRQARGAVGNMAHFFRDLAALVELQGLLFLVDAGEEFRKVRKALLLIALFSVIGASCVPLGLAGVALVLSEQTRLTIGQAMLCVSAGGLPLACGGLYAAAVWANPGTGCMQRSRMEWKCNVNWIKETLKHLGDGRHDPCKSRSGAST